MRDLVKSENAVSAVVGVIVILALTITSISVIFLYGVPTLYKMEDMANAQKVEQAFTVFDSRTSKVALGESPSQTTSFSMMDGDIQINGDNASYEESQIVIITMDTNITLNLNFEQNCYRWRGWESYAVNGSMNEFNSSMGSIVFTNDDRIIGYEGGGVWSKYPNGKSVMISPPEFHYNGETLTLPIMRIEGNEVAGGKGDVAVTVSSDNMPVVLYPDSAIDLRRTNPLTSDKVIIYIKSEFYNAWADYANSLAYASAVTDDANKTAVVELEVIPAMGTEQLKSVFKVGAVNQYNPTPMQDFVFDLGCWKNTGLANLKYAISATSGTKTLTYLLQEGGGPDQIMIDVWYEDTSISAEIEKWTGGNDQVFIITGEQEDAESTIDLLSTSLNLSYDGPDPDFSWDDATYTDDDDKLPLYNLTQHYMKLITLDGSVIFNVQSQQSNGKGNGDSVDYDESTLTLMYDGMPGSITYLHVSRNDLVATLN